MYSFHLMQILQINMTTLIKTAEQLFVGARTVRMMPTSRGRHPLMPILELKLKHAQLEGMSTQK